MKRLNIPLLIALALLLVGGVAGMGLLHRYQLRRNAETMAVDAQKRLDDGKEAAVPLEAVTRAKLELTDRLIEEHRLAAEGAAGQTH